MNVAVDPERRREGIATALIERLFEEAGAEARYTLEVRVSNHGAIAMYERFGFRAAGHRRRYYHDNGEDALIMWLGAGAGRRLSARLILAIETSCDDTCAAVVDGGRILLQRHLLAGRGSRALRRRRAGGRLAPPPRAGQPGGRRGARARRASTLDDVDAVAVTRGPGLIGALLVGVATAKALAAAHRASRWSASTTCTATSPPTSSSPTRSSRRSCA